MPCSTGRDRPLTQREVLQEEYIALYGDQRDQPADGPLKDPNEQLPGCATDAEKGVCKTAEAAQGTPEEVEAQKEAAELAREKAWIRQIHQRAKNGEPRTAL